MNWVNNRTERYIYYIIVRYDLYVLMSSSSFSPSSRLALTQFTYFFSSFSALPNNSLITHATRKSATFFIVLFLSERRDDHTARNFTGWWLIFFWFIKKFAWINFFPIKYLNFFSHTFSLMINFLFPVIKKALNHRFLFIFDIFFQFFIS